MLGRLVGALAPVAVLACAGAAAAAVKTVSATKPVLTIGTPAGPVSLDPAQDSLTWITVRSMTNEPLLHMRSDGSFAPALATKWRYFPTGSGPNKGFELTLRQNARFSNGEPVTAQAVKAWFEYFPTRTGVSAAQMGAIKSITTVGRWTVRIQLRSSNPSIPRLLSEADNWGAVSAPKAVADPTVLATGTYGAGPYRLDASQTVTNNLYVLVPNPYYYDKSKIKWSKVVVRIIPNPSSMLQALQTGQVDVAAGDATTADAASKAGFKLVQAKIAAVGLMFADREGRVAKQLGDVRVRQALNYAIDRNAITKALAGKYGTPTSEIAITDGFDPKVANYYSYNPARARSLLAAAGYSNGGFTLECLTGSFFGITGDPLVQAIAKYWEAVGVTLKPVSTATPGEYVQKQRSATIPVMMNSVGGGTMSQVYGFGFHPNSPVNPFGANDPIMNKLWLQGQKAANPATYWVQMARRTVTQAYYVNVWAARQIIYVSKRVTGVVMAQPRPTVLASEWSPA